MVERVVSLTPTSSPKHTTPSLDFAKFARELRQLVDAVEDVRDGFFEAAADAAAVATAGASSSPGAAGADAAREGAAADGAAVGGDNGGDGDGVSRVVELKAAVVRTCVEHVLRRFNALTTPPLKKPVAGKALGPDLPRLSVQSTHEFDPTLSPQQQAGYHLLRGRLYSVFGQYHPLAEMNLARSVKLDPSNVEAWNMLGGCYWEKGDFELARYSFEMAIEQGANAKSIWMLGTTLRMLDPTKKGIDEALAKYKEALALDVNCEDAWCEWQQRRG
nr:hypothetical protein HK105_006711 [Polyrhizophydium stewartii]